MNSLPSETGPSPIEEHAFFPYLFHYQVIEKGHDANIQRLHSFLRAEVSKDLKASKLEELLLGIRKVSEH